jgi:hypothetical protein
MQIVFGYFYQGMLKLQFSRLLRRPLRLLLLPLLQTLLLLSPLLLPLLLPQLGPFLRLVPLLHLLFVRSARHILSLVSLSGIYQIPSVLVP